MHMVVSTLSLESEMLHNFQVVFFSNMIGIAIFKYSPTVYQRLIEVGRLIEVQCKLDRNASKNDFIDSIQQNAFKSEHI